MGKIYVGQDFKITLTLNEDITGALSTKIAYRKANKEEGEWIATIVDNATGKISHNVLADENTEQGILTCWARVTDSQGLYYPSTPSSFEINKEGM